MSTVYNVSEKTLSLLPAILDHLGITNPVLEVTETKTLVKIRFLGFPEPVTLRKSAPVIANAVKQSPTRPQEDPDHAARTD